MEQTRALNALAPFLALAKSATSPRAASDLITQATSAANTYVFAELLETQAIKNLRQDDQYANYHQLLEIFAWGTWEDYQASSSTLPSLNDSQTHKLRLLTLLTLAARASSSSELSYSNLQSALSLPTPRALESLVTAAIYADLLHGTLNPAQQTVVITSVAPLRDLAPGSVGAMVRELEAWSQRCEGVLSDLEAEVERVKMQAGKKGRREAEVREQIAKAVERAEVPGEGEAGGLRGLGRGVRKGTRADSNNNMEEDFMDVDGGGPRRDRRFLARKKG